MSRSTDLVSWEYVGDAFTEATLPAWADRTRGRPCGPRTSATSTAGTGSTTSSPTPPSPPRRTTTRSVWRFSDSPTGPWTDSGGPVVGPRRGGAGEPGNFLWTFDPATSWVRRHRVPLLRLATTAASGSPSSTPTAPGPSARPPRSRSTTSTRAPTSSSATAGGTCSRRRPTAAPARRPATASTWPLARPARARTSTARACRSTSRAPAGRRCWRRTATAGSAPATTPSSPTWPVRTGSLYHAIDRHDPYLTAPTASTSGPCCSTGSTGSAAGRTVRAGAWASEGTQPGPITGGSTVTDFTAGSPATSGRWASGRWPADPQTGTALRSAGRGMNTRADLAVAAGPQVRVEADVRTDPGAAGEYGLVAASPPGTGITAAVDPATAPARGHARPTSGAVTGPRARRCPADYDPPTGTASPSRCRGGRRGAELTQRPALGDPRGRRSTLPCRSGTSSTGRRGQYAGARASGWTTSPRCGRPLRSASRSPLPRPAGC